MNEQGLTTHIQKDTPITFIFTYDVEKFLEEKYYSLMIIKLLIFFSGKTE